MIELILYTVAYSSDPLYGFIKGIVVFSAIILGIAKYWRAFDYINKKRDEIEKDDNIKEDDKDYILAQISKIRKNCEDGTSKIITCFKCLVGLVVLSLLFITLYSLTNYVILLLVSLLFIVLLCICIVSMGYSMWVIYIAPHQVNEKITESKDIIKHVMDKNYKNLLPKENKKQGILKWIKNLFMILLIVLYL